MSKTTAVATLYSKAAKGDGHTSLVFSADLVEFTRDEGAREIPEGYEPQENSFAKNHAMDALEAELEKQGVEVHSDDDDGGIDLIDLADVVVEALIRAGVTIPEDISNPHKR